MAIFASPVEFFTFAPDSDSSSERVAAVQQSLEIATQTIKDYTEQDIEAVAGRVETFRAKSCVSSLILSQLPVTAITSVTTNAVAFSPYSVDLKTGILSRTDNLSWLMEDVATITYNSGYPTIPFSIRGICMRVAKAMLDNPNAVANYSIGNYSQTAGSQSEGSFTKGERMILDRYRA